MNNDTSKTSPAVRFLEVADAGDGQRVDNFLLRHLKGVPKSRIYRIIRKGEVRINKKRCKPDSRLLTGDTVRIPPVFMADPTIPPKPSDQLSTLLLDSVLFENDDMIILNKPPGLSVHGGSGIRLGLIEALRQLKPQWRSAELAHRLDRDTSGCLAIAKNTIFLKYLHSKFKAKTIKKTYLALVHGQWSESVSVVDAPLLKNELLSGERVVRVDSQGKPSLTRFKVLETLNKVTLLQAMPETGRTHQIRVHCLYGGHPIVGDVKYTPSDKQTVSPDVKQLCLHAFRLKFAIPNQLEECVFEAPLHTGFRQILDSFHAKY